MKVFDHRSGEQLEIDGAKIYFETGGRPEAPVLLFLHGGFGTIEDFGDVIRQLETEFRIIGIDSRGHGRSTLGPEVLTYQLIQKDVEQILDHLNIDTLNIIGFSDGGIVAYRLASLTSLKIEKLVTIGSRWHLKNTEAAKELFLKTTGESWRKKFPDTYCTYQKLNAEPDFDRLAESLVGMWLDGNASGYPNQAVRNFSCPLLIVRGDDDHITSKETVFELSETVPNAHLLNIPFAGHAAFVDHKEIFMTSLNEFLGS